MSNEKEELKQITKSVNDGAIYIVEYSLVI